MRGADDIVPAAAAEAAPVPDGAEEHVAAERLRVAAVTPFTTIDFPGKLAAVAFLQGCPWRCIYCQNPWMQPAEFDPGLEHSSWERLEALLARRRGLLDAVVFSGGEPACDPALPDAIARVRAMGFAVGLHTAGILPARLERILPQLDWIGLDVKAPPGDEALWERITGRRHAARHFLESYRLIRASGVPFECRTTAHPDWLDDAKLLELAGWLRAERIETFALQIYRRPPQGLFAAAFPHAGADYPQPETVRALAAACTRFIERRNDR